MDIRDILGDAAYSTADVVNNMAPPKPQRVGFFEPEIAAERERLNAAYDKPTIAGKGIATLFPGMDAPDRASHASHPSAGAAAAAGREYDYQTARELGHNREVNGARGNTSWADAARSTMWTPYRLATQIAQAFSAADRSGNGEVNYGPVVHQEVDKNGNTYISDSSTITPDKMIGEGLNVAGNMAITGGIVPKPTNAAGMFGGRLAKEIHEAQVAANPGVDPNKLAQVIRDVGQNNQFPPSHQSALHSMNHAPTGTIYDFLKYQPGATPGKTEISGYRGAREPADRIVDQPWASTRKESADTYARDATKDDQYVDGSRVMPLRFNFNNPLVVEGNGARYSDIPLPGMDKNNRIWKGVAGTEDIASSAMANGHDGVIFKDILDDAHGRGPDQATAVVALRPGTTYSALTGDLLYANGKASSLPGTVIREASQRSVDPLGYYSGALEAAKAIPQAKGTPEQMLAMLKKGGAKDAEIEATGLPGLLGGKASVTRDEIVKHLEANRVGLKEVQRSKDGNATGLLDFFGGRSNDVSAQPPKWQDYSLDPSNPSYRERVLHLPTPDRVADLRRARDQADAVMTTRRQAGEDAAMQARGLPFNPQADPVWSEARRLYDAAEAKIADLEGKQFQSGHFPEPNIVGHTMSSMVKHEGKPTLLLDQIQSDWGQKLRDGGVRDEAKIAELKQRFDAEKARLFAAIRAKFPGHDPASISEKSLGKAGISWKELDRLLAEVQTAESATSGHPLVNTTDQWTNTTLRNALKQAVDGDAENIAIPSGKTVLSYNPGNEHGMSTFYDKIVPKNLGNILGKYDGSVKGSFFDQLETPGKGMAGEGFTVFPITDKVREAVRAGQPLFANSDAKAGAVVTDKQPRQSRFTFGANEAKAADDFRYPIYDNGKDVGHVEGFVDKKGKAHINWIGPPMSVRQNMLEKVLKTDHIEKKPFDLGISGIKDLREHFRSDFPDVTNFSGWRVSGSRKNAPTLAKQTQHVTMLENGDGVVAPGVMMRSSADDDDVADALDLARPAKRSKRAHGGGVDRALSLANAYD